MKGFFKNIINDKITRLGFVGSFGILITSLVFILFFYNRLPPFIPIFNQLSWGEQRLGETIAIFLPTLTAFLVLALNLFLSALMYERLPLVSRMIALTSISVSILVLLFTIRTIQLVL